MNGTIYALLVGITKYDRSISLDNGTVYFDKLDGCVNDAGKIKKVLQDNYQSTVIKELYNDQATKSRICESFIGHLGQGKAGDSILFYFSGHGTQEYADACFTSETDGLMECLVAYYSSDSNTKDFLIADKELRYLIGRVSKSGIACTVIIDCCHSGDATRNAEVLRVNYPAPVEKRSRGTYVFQKRDWNSFIFSNEFSRDDFEEKGIETVLPPGKHVLFSASESNQAAVEIAGEGIFTKHLTNIWSLTAGRLSNLELYQHVRTRMRFAYQQTPRLYAPSPAEAIMSNQLLSHKPLSKINSGRVYWSYGTTWVLDRGATHGIGTDLRTIQVFDPPTGAYLDALIAEVGMAETKLVLPSSLDRDKVYTAEVESLARSILKVYLNIGGAIPADAISLINAIDKLPVNTIQWVNGEEQADLVLQHLQGVYYLSKPLDPCRPVAESIKFHDHGAIVDQLRQISRWKFLKDLSVKSRTGIDRNKVLKLEYAFDEEFTVVPWSDTAPSEIEIKNWKFTGSKFSKEIKIRFTNVADNPIYLSVLYLDNNFSSSTSLMEPSPYLLEPGNSVFLHIGQFNVLVASLIPQTFFYNYKDYFEHLKVIVDDKPFNIYTHVMEPLPEPPVPGMTPSRYLKGAFRSIGGEDGVRPLSTEQWFTSTVNIRSVNEWHNIVPFQIISAMLEDQLTSIFAVSLYFRASTNESGVFTVGIGLNDEIQLVDSDSPGELTEEQTASLRKRAAELAAISWSNRRNHYYQEISQRFPERTRIVAAGDSWLQHPFTKDTVDYLSATYAVNVFNWDGAFTPEMLLETLRPTKPAFFLMSTGGNSLFGPGFKNYLADRPILQAQRGTSDAKACLTSHVDIEVEKLIGNLSIILKYLSFEFPDLKVIIHGYDYPAGLHDPETSAIGRTMLEEGLSNKADRQAIVMFLVDLWNDRLEEMARGHRNTYYLDLRRTLVSEDKEHSLWYNSAVPNRHGFEHVALKYTQLIEKIKKGGYQEAV